MRYFVLLAQPTDGWTGASDAQRAEWHQNHIDFHREVGASILSGEALAGVGTATTMRRVDGDIVLTDGPFAETAEIIGGYYLIDAPDLDQLVRWCALLPALYSIELRPCIAVDGID